MLIFVVIVAGKNHCQCWYILHLPVHLESQTDSVSCD